MESAEGPVRYNIHSSVTKLFKHEGQWFVHFLGSWESLGLGPDEPGLQIGDQVSITIERINAKSSTAPK